MSHGRVASVELFLKAILEERRYTKAKRALDFQLRACLFFEIIHSESKVGASTMHKTSKLAMILGIFLSCQLLSTTAQGVDVYVVYSGRDGGLRNQVVGAMPGNLDVKTYNVDLLALADYSGKQKAVSKISRAGVVVIVGSRPMQLLNKTKIKSNLLVVGSTSTGVKATEARIYVLGQGASAAGLGSSLSVSSREDFDDRRKVQSAGAVLVDESGMTVMEAVALIAQSLVG